MTLVCSGRALLWLESPAYDGQDYLDYLHNSHDPIGAAIVRAVTYH